MEVAAVGGKNTSLKVGRNASNKQKESLPSSTAPLGKDTKLRADLPKNKVLAKIWNYMQLLGRRIDQIVLEYEKEPHKQESHLFYAWKQPLRINPKGRL
ncbi:hypothetical protein K7X08_014076 [Anisodus acutangulus]|uniref:Uncharacterized protein n=1 Tax=Anisodus acutangulus TaxID=402998 RepID=A0A9Q1LQ00_9SOLA|nr:hypothetical protein K7X08_014076 [Anisodus acutangulus]